MIQYVNLPPCNKCLKRDRMVNAGTHDTDTKGTILIALCKRCVVVQIAIDDSFRPPEIVA